MISEQREFTCAATTNTYDPHGRLSTSTDARNGTTTYAYNNADQVTSITNPVPGAGQSAQVTQYDYDSRGRVWRTVLPDDTSVTNEFFPTGLLKKTYGTQVLQFAFAAAETIADLPQRASLGQLAEKHRHKLRPTAKTPGVTLRFEFTHVPGEIRALKERQNLGKQTGSADHLRSPLMMGCGFNFTRILIKDGDLFQPFSKPNLDTSVLSQK